MRRDDFGKRTRGSGGLLGALFGIQVDEQPDEPQTQTGGQSKIVARTPKIEPTVKRVSLGVSPYGDVVNMPLFERHLLICGASGSGKSVMGNRLLAEIVKIPKELRLISMVDLKGGTEAGRFSRVVDTIARDIEEADTVITNLIEEMKRREALINSNPEKYWGGKIEPTEGLPLLVLYIDELAILGKKRADKDEEEIRKHAYSGFSELLFRARSSAVVVIACVQRSSTDVLDGFTRNNFANRIAGRVATRSDSETIFGMGSSEYMDASKLRDFWFYYFIEGEGTGKFKCPIEPGDADLKACLLNPVYYKDPLAGAWLTAEPGTPESIPDFWKADAEPATFRREKDNAPADDPLDGLRELSVDELMGLVNNPGAVKEMFDEEEQGADLRRETFREVDEFLQEFEDEEEGETLAAEFSEECDDEEDIGNPFAVEEEECPPASPYDFEWENDPIVVERRAKPKPNTTARRRSRRRHDSPEAKTKGRTVRGGVEWDAF